MTGFDDFSLRPETRAALAAMSVTTPTPIQAAALPHLIAGRDVIGQARTGSGKTLAFVLPMLERIQDRRRDVQALVLVPTRELASQVAGVVRDAAAGRGVRVLLLVGGTSLGPQRQALKHGIEVVVGTPGRVLDHINQGDLRLDRLRLLVLDEADEMLDRGFARDVERIIGASDTARQTAMFSATVPEWVSGMAARYLREPVMVRVEALDQPVENVLHTVYDVPEGGKPAALRALLDSREPGVTLVFGRTKHGVKKLARQLEDAGYPVAALQGNLSQNARDRVMAEFRSGAVPILVATNVAARGLDVEHVSRVINYELPETAGLLTHRVGRTGRMGRDGEAITLLTREDEPAWRKLLRELARHPVRRPWRGNHDSSSTAPVETGPARAPVAAMVLRPAPAERPAPPPPFGGRRSVPAAPVNNHRPGDGGRVVRPNATPPSRGANPNGRPHHASARPVRRPLSPVVRTAAPRREPAADGQAGTGSERRA